MVEPVTLDFFGEFKPDACTVCGECLIHCPIIDYTIEEAKEEMRRLIVKEKTKKLLRDCQSCFTCNLYCQKQANPASLILKRWNEQYKKEGLKVRGKYFMTLYPNYPNFRSYAADKMTREEKHLLKQWSSLDPLKGDTLTYPGCNVILTPTLTQTKIFADLDIRGRLEYCCGETLFRTGYKKELFQVTKRLDKWFNTLKPKKLLVLCTAGTNVFKNVLPHYGLTYQFEKITSYIEWLWEKFEKGEIVVTKPLNMTVTIQESCYSKMFGDQYMDLPRNILRRIGCDIVEMEKSRENMRCCGIGAGFSVDSAYNSLKIRDATVKNLDDAKATGASAICVYCSGCLQQYFTAKKLYLKKTPPIYHIIELIQLAIGETPIRLVEHTAQNMFWGIMKNQMPRLLSPKRFKIPEIPEDPEEDAY
ncbi:MAG: (Fe-S)-binding protein [Candidatus Lokiarchaeota archaeon]|nr:(Fe-S)-binding protein [Candidatus Lokiarchaeota archaeon]